MQEAGSGGGGAQGEGRCTPVPGLDVIARAGHGIRRCSALASGSWLQRAIVDNCISDQYWRYSGCVARWNPEPKFLADLGPGHRLYAHCARCRRTKLLDVHSLEVRFGPFYAIDDVRKRVRCTQCKQLTNTLRRVSERR